MPLQNPVSCPSWWGRRRGQTQNRQGAQTWPRGAAGPAQGWAVSLCLMPSGCRGFSRAQRGVRGRQDWPCQEDQPCVLRWPCVTASVGLEIEVSWCAMQASHRHWPPVWGPWCREGHKWTVVMARPPPHAPPLVTCAASQVLSVRSANPFQRMIKLQGGLEDPRTCSWCQKWRLCPLTFQLG